MLKTDSVDHNNDTVVYPAANGTLYQSPITTGGGYSWCEPSGIEYHFSDWDEWWKWHCNYYHDYPIYITEKIDANRIAFRVAAELIKMDLVEDLTVDQFIKLVSSIEDIIEKHKTR